MMVATAENPRLLDPVREVINTTLDQLKTTSDDLDAALLGWLATEGLSNLEMHNLSPFSEDDRDRIVQRHRPPRRQGHRRIGARCLRPSRTDRSKPHPYAPRGAATAAVPSSAAHP